MIATPTSAAPAARIGMFDSGVGGLSVLAALHRHQPGAPIHYVADSAHAPYGELPDEAIRDRAERIGRHLIGAGAQVVVVACNTATAVAVDHLRGTLAPCPIVGIEPGLRPALAASRNGHVGIMATAATLRSARFRALLAREAGDRPVHLQACVGLAAAIEHDELDDPQLATIVARHCRALRDAGVDSVALGCTHYPFVRSAIERELGPDVVVIDTADAVAAQVARVCAGVAPAIASDGASIGTPICLLETTGDPVRLRRFAERWLAVAVQVAAAPAGL